MQQSRNGYYLYDCPVHIEGPGVEKQPIPAALAQTRNPQKRRNNKMKVLLTALTALLLAPPDSLPGAELKVAGVFSQNTVLQRDKPIPVWGWAEAGVKVTVEFAGQKRAATAEQAGAGRCCSIRCPPVRRQP